MHCHLLYQKHRADQAGLCRRTAYRSLRRRSRYSGERPAPCRWGGDGLGGINMLAGLGVFGFCCCNDIIILVQENSIRGHIINGVIHVQLLGEAHNIQSIIPVSKDNCADGLAVIQIRVFRQRESIATGPRTV